MKPLCIVTPWFGKDLKGGAEQQAWQVATRLAAQGHTVEVLTTCCRSFLDNWTSNYYRPGVRQEQGVKVRHFRVNRRNEEAFARVNSLMLNLPSSALKPQVNPVNPEDSLIFASENINSAKLLNFLKRNKDQYHAFLFLPYLYGPVLNGLPIVADRAFLQPCLHDEVYAYLPEVTNIFHLARGLLFISEGEAQLATQLYGPGIIHKSSVAGAGIEAGSSFDESLTHVGGFSVKQEQFVLCLGRRDSGKNTDLLVKAFAHFKQENPASDLKLVLAGPGNRSYSGLAPDLIDLGLVEEKEKELLLANCLALFQPSQNESYSRVIMEAWFYKRPVAAHRNCLATAIAVEKAQGGWLAETELEWSELFDKVDQIGEEQLTKYGIKGQVYAEENAAWDKIIQRYEIALNLTERAVTSPLQLKPKKLKEIHQLLPNLAYGDAISNHAIEIRNYLRQCGYRSEIFVRYLDQKVAHEATVFSPRYLDNQAGLIYHHSIGSELTEYAIAHSGPKCLVYHNITPAEFFLPYRPDVAKLLEDGRTELRQLAQHFPVSVGDSTFNVEELLEVGFAESEVLPIIVNPKKWDTPPDAALMRQLQDGKTNLLFVGRIAPNKRQNDLIEAFAHYLTFDQEARLILLGGYGLTDPYYFHLINLIDKLNLANHVLLPGLVTEAQLLAYYRTADVFWSMSEHEGFCVPLVEAMWFDTPILAYKSSAVPETLGSAGLIFNSKNDLVQVAALAKLLVKDKELKSNVIKAQRQRRNDFLTELGHGKLDNLILKMENVSV
ncbi:glycosyltransferase family 4 protein [Leptolyngbya sp. FACHB-671]|uniref:glycosyltransferase family 4 protein n=1 Tax=Leptolyngbya sp. FACHB-671 TaxID=2692812 RepID=UPI001684B1D3|nr:glycosyltransferase family 4 protein [Leptolyngbya sp. FACHB-671]MBD2068584.1 glycosyltransferase family 4 protein [Leptolyngbya sp. FACHB-671]